jgi:hypothetical protein
MPLVVAIIVLLSVGGAAFVIAGVHLLAGMAWAFIVLGLLLFGVAVYLRSGLTPHG